MCSHLEQALRQQQQIQLKGSTLLLIFNQSYSELALYTNATDLINTQLRPTILMLNLFYVLPDIYYDEVIFECAPNLHLKEFDF